MYFFLVSVIAVTASALELLGEVISFPSVRLGGLSQYNYSLTSTIQFETLPRGSFGGIFIINNSSANQDTCLFENLVEPVINQTYNEPLLLCYYADSTNPGDYNKYDLIQTIQAEFEIFIENPIEVESLIPFLYFTDEGSDTNSIELEVESDSFDDRSYGYIVDVFPSHGVLLVNDIPMSNQQNILNANDVVKYRPNGYYFNIATGLGGNPFLNELSIPISQCSNNNSGCPEVIEFRLYPVNRPDLYTNQTIKLNVYVEHVLTPLIGIVSVLDGKTLSANPLDIINASIYLMDVDQDTEYVSVTLKITPSDAGYLFFKDITRDQYIDKVNLTDCPLVPEYASCSLISFTGLPSQVNTILSSVHVAFAQFSFVASDVTWNRANADLIVYDIEVYKLNQPSTIYAKSYSFMLTDDSGSYPYGPGNLRTGLRPYDIAMIVLIGISITAMIFLIIERFWPK